MKRIKTADWVFGRSNEFEFIGFVLAKDKSQCRVQVTQAYNFEKRCKEDVENFKQQNITRPISDLTLLDDYHVDDIMELIDMSLDSGNKRDFNRLTRYLDLVKDNKEIPKKLWKVRRYVR